MGLEEVGPMHKGPENSLEMIPRLLSATRGALTPRQEDTCFGSHI